MNKGGEITLTLKQLFTDKELRRIEQLWAKSNDFHNDVLFEIVQPAMERINRITKQQNDARYLAYAIEATLTFNTKPPAT